jgi:hypothetical protein
MRMLVKNSKISAIWVVLQAIANAKVSARLKYACNLNRGKLEPYVTALEKARTESAEREAEWSTAKDQMILEHCLKDEKTGTPLVFQDGYQFANRTQFQAMLDAMKVRDFSDVHAAHLKRDQEYLKLLDEDVDIAGFPYRIKWNFVDLDENGDFKGINGEQMYVLMSNGMMDGEPPWLSEDAGQKSSAKEPDTKPAVAEKE